MVGSRLALAKRDELSRVTIGEGLPYDHVQLAVTLRGFSPVAIEKALTFPKPLTKTVAFSRKSDNPALVPNTRLSARSPTYSRAASAANSSKSSVPSIPACIRLLLMFNRVAKPGASTGTRRACSCRHPRPSSACIRVRQAHTGSHLGMRLHDARSPDMPLDNLRYLVLFGDTGRVVVLFKPSEVSARGSRRRAAMLPAQQTNSAKSASSCSGACADGVPGHLNINRLPLCAGAYADRPYGSSHHRGLPLDSRRHRPF